MKYKMRNKRGELLTGNLIFLMITVTFLMVFISLFVFDVANTYDNTEMMSDWNAKNVNSTGMRILDEYNTNATTMFNNFNSNTGIIGKIIGGITGVISAASDILYLMFATPYLFGLAIKNMLDAMAVPGIISGLIVLFVNLAFYLIIPLLIVRMVMKGGKF